MNYKIIIVFFISCTLNHSTFTGEVPMFEGTAKSERVSPKPIPYLTIAGTKYPIEIGRPIPPEVLARSRKKILDDVMRSAETGRTIIGFRHPKSACIVYAAVKSYSAEHLDSSFATLMCAHYTDPIVIIPSEVIIEIDWYLDEKKVPGENSYHIITTEFPE